MHRSSKFIAAAAFAVLAAAGGSAFTGTGVIQDAGASQFVGGTVAQTVTGATLTDVAYDFSDTTNTLVSSVTLTFAAGANGKTVVIDAENSVPTQLAFWGSSANTGTIATNTVTFTPGVDATPVPVGDLTSLTITVS